MDFFFLGQNILFILISLGLWNAFEPQPLGWRWPKSDFKVTFPTLGKSDPLRAQKWLKSDFRGLEMTQKSPFELFLSP